MVASSWPVMTRGVFAFDDADALGNRFCRQTIVSGDHDDPDGRLYDRLQSRLRLQVAADRS